MDITKQKDDILHQIRRLKLMDDVLMVKCFEDNPKCTELLLHLIMKKSSVRVDRVKAMWHGVSVGLAVLATDSSGWRYKIRVFRDNTADQRRRSGLDLYSTEYAAVQAGIDQKIFSHVAIFIVEHGATHKPIDRGGITLDGGGEHGHWGFTTQAFYLNCDRKNRSPLGKLVYDFSCTDPAYMNYPLLAARVRYFKESRQGIRDMHEILEQKRKKYEASKDN